LKIFALRDDGAAYEAVSQSRLLPDLDIALLERCVAIRSWQQARRAFRVGFDGSHCSVTRLGRDRTGVAVMIG
jgi:hypothetical protein